MPRVAGTLGTEAVDVPIACTLGADAMPDGSPRGRRSWPPPAAAARWARRGCGSSSTRSTSPSWLAFVAAEQECCSFFASALTVDGRGVGLEVVVPPGAEGILADLFGLAA